MSNVVTIQNIIDGEHVSSEKYLALKDDLKKIFYSSKGYMAWLRDRGESYNQARSTLIENMSVSHGQASASEFVETALQKAYELALDNLNLRLFRVVDDFCLWQDSPHFTLKNSPYELYKKICDVINNGTNKQKEKLCLLLGVYAEGSLSQARKSLAGSGGEVVLGALLKLHGIDYGTQFKSTGSDTDIVIPNTKNDDEVKAYIAIQTSSNDRTRLTTSELVAGKRNYFCSFNGCSASSKDTTDIGNEIVSKFTHETISYVVISREKEAALNSAKERLNRALSKSGNNQDEVTRCQTKVDWLENKCITFEEFIEQVKSL